MEHRDPVRIDTPDGPARPPSTDRVRMPRLARITSIAAERRILPRHPIILGVVGVISLAMAYVLVTNGYRRVIRYVHSQAIYQITFREIRLIPEPPAWYRGGRDAFLDDVPRAGALNPGPFSVLNLDPAALDRLSKLLKRNPVVKRVEMLEVHHPNAVIAKLDYREPVAIARSRGEPDVIVDSDGVLLPPDRVENSAIDGLIELKRSTFSPPVDPRLGQPWRRGFGPEGNTPAQPDERVLLAARLAAFLRNKLGSPDASEGFVREERPRITLYNIGEHGFWVQWGDRVFFQWANPRTGELSHKARWEMMVQWLHDNPAAAAAGPVHLGFTPQGVTPVSVKSRDSAG